MVLASLTDSCKGEAKRSGFLAFHISNSYLDLEPVLAGLARAHGLAGIARRETGRDLSDVEWRRGKKPSHWVLLAWRRDELGKLTHDPRWHSLPNRPNLPLWTDDFSNLLGVLKW